MGPHISLGDGAADGGLQVLWRDLERALYRRPRADEKGAPRTVLTLRLTVDPPPPASVQRLVHEYELKDHLESAWAVLPLELVRDRERTMLVLEDPGGEPLDRQLGEPMEIGRFLPLAVAIAASLGRMHQRGLVHKDLKPAHLMVIGTSGEVRLTGFGFASRLPRERQPPGPPEFIAGTLAYMAPEQTGRMNRSIDSRSDLYALGVIFYQMLTGVLPFTASEPIEWVHCHIARTPVPPHERVANIPRPISHIVTKLLAKTAEERYQTATGVERDLRRCLVEWQASGHIAMFLPGETDAPDRLSVPEKLYGRARDVETLLNAFDRVVANGRPGLVLVSGYSGIGKSAVVNELHRALVPSRALFASGKSDQYKRDIPYATLAQALQNLIRPLLGKSEAELHHWRQTLGEALGPNGQLILNLVPELKLIVGEQPPVPALPPQDAQARFQLLLRRVFGVFARPEHPLALFLDDLQWLDLATLDLLVDLLRQPDLQYLMLIGAYRANEVQPSHPLLSRIEAIRQAGATIDEIILTPLTCNDLATLIADTLHSAPERVTPLADLIHAKSGGNPFFAIQFISALFDEALLTFDHSRGEWSWDLSRIRAKGYTDNVLDLMVGKLNRLPSTTQAALKDLACLGNSADFTTLSIAHATTEEAVHLELWEALRMECIARSGHSYKFVHDRIQEAAYSLIPEPSRAEVHLRIGRLLAARTTPDNEEDAIFEIVNQLNRGTSLITSRDEREQLAAFNLIAGKRARASAAYASALTYLIAGAALLASDRWQRHHDLAFALELHRAECEVLTGALVAAETRLTMLVSRAVNTIDRVAVESLRIDLYTTLDQTDRVVASCLDYLRHLGVDWTPHPTEQEARHEYQRIWLQLGSRAIEDLTALPLMSDPQSLAIMDVLAKIYPTVTLTDANLLSLTVCRAINLSLEQGNCDASCVAYVYFGKIAGPRFGDYNAGAKFGQLGYTLVAQRGLRRFEARTCHWLAQFGLPWTKHAKACREMIWRAFEAAIKVGDLNIAVYSLDNLNTNLLAAGDPLVEAERQAETGLAFAKRTRFGHQIDVQATQLALIRTLRGLTYGFGCLDDGQYSEAQVEQHFTPHPAVYWIRKLQARFFAGDYAAALDSAARAQPMLWTLAAMFESAEFHFYAALSHAACCASPVSGQSRPVLPRTVADVAPSSRPMEYTQHLEALATHHLQLDAWASHCPENFENRAALVAAEIARIEGRHLAAEHLYEHAIHSARTNGFIHNEALANELAGRFYLARGLGKIGQTYLQDARHGYLQWGANGKVRQLDDLYPQFGKVQAPPGPTSTISTPIDHLDLATVIKVSQTVSSEIVLERLIETIMRTAVEQAGAERGALVVSRGGELRCVAVAWTRPTTITVELRDEPVAEAMLPQSVLQYVARTEEAVILDDGAASPTFSADPYICQRQARSMLCLPLLTQAKFGGLLYLENNLTPRAFVPGRTAVLKLLASQAAIALENASLYRDVAEREARIRRLVDANIIGTFIWKTKGPRDEPDDILIIEANDAFLRIVGYDREDLAAGRLCRSILAPPGWCERDAQNMVNARMNRTVLPFEKEYLRKDGSRVPVLLGFAAFDQQLDQGVAFVVDLTERKRAEVEAREAQMELAHANRVAAIGQLSASIGHEISQPLSGVITNSETGLLWLQTGPPNVQEAVAAFSRVVRDGKRATAIVNRIRALVKKAPPQKDMLHINEAIQEIVDLTRSEAAKNSVSVQTHLGERLPPIRGDRVQLQQVVLNLVVNAVEAIGSSEAERREILIETARTGSDDILVSVRDTGPGPDPDNMERMFDAFYSTKALGLGLGLSICRSIIEAHGGSLWATPGAPQGAVFQFTLLGEQNQRVTH